MKKILFSLGFVGVLTLFMGTLQVNAEETATIYEDTNLSGNSIDLKTGMYEEEYVDKKDKFNYRKIIKNYDGKSVGNDTISSLSIPKGFRVILTENNDFKGRTRSIENRYDVENPVERNSTLNYSTIEASEILNLSSYQFDNKTSSIIVEEMKYDPISPVVYEDSEFRKPSKPLARGDYKKRDLPFGNDKISGIRVPEGYKVRMWDDDNYNDRNYTYVGPTTIPFLEGFNDKVSSMKIRYAWENI
ncbi:hypothetical protein [Enterococcus sp. LJL51]|uniref:hypothetical protein n=1 Tax=Enterococcus sp. LJL51 TaxID=3416656 RepID=UPI003CEB9715